MEPVQLYYKLRVKDRVFFVLRFQFSVPQCEAQLPGDAEAIGAPAELLAEGIGLERHEDLAALRELWEETLDLALVIAFYEKRNGGREGERVLCGTVDEEKCLPG